ncbi:probable allantoinase isoform X4 [Camellia sinensis]|uniref:probable allantoinase isoform X4 n=1 Tax=Camellia sinensis TaxID=4442 RepID=UPI001035792B|nr:probable allantoinase isoform X4 [Camellia sinensis]
MTEEEINVLPVHKYKVAGSQRHEHLDDPRRAEWQGFPSRTRAATAGGLTTLVDMPLNSFPSTIAEKAFELKEEAANRELLTVANDARAGGPAEGAHLHIVHLSDARSSLDLIKEAKSGDSNGDSTTIGFGALPHQKSLHRSSRWRLQMLATRSWARFSRKVYNSKNYLRFWSTKTQRRRQMLQEKHFYQRLNWKPRRRKILSPRKRIKIRERIRIQRLLKVMTCMYRKRKLKNKFTFLLATMVIILVL